MVADNLPVLCVSFEPDRTFPCPTYVDVIARHESEVFASRGVAVKLNDVSARVAPVVVPVVELPMRPQDTVAAPPSATTHAAVNEAQYLVHRDLLSAT